MAKIQLNGKQLKINNNLSIKDLLKKYKLNERKIAIEINGMILPKNHYKKKRLKTETRLRLFNLLVADNEKRYFEN